MEEANYRGDAHLHISASHHLCPTLAKDLATLCAPWSEAFTQSIHEGNRSHPFPTQLLDQIRQRINAECSTSHDFTGIEEGQPFHLDLIAAIAHQLGDPDWECTLLP